MRKNVLVLIKTVEGNHKQNDLDAELTIDTLTLTFN
jgi:hypothetical protein